MPRGRSDYDAAAIQSRLWTPELLKSTSGLTAWYDAVLNTTHNGVGVSPWRDKSGKGTNAAVPRTPFGDEPSLQSTPIFGVTFASGNVLNLSGPTSDYSVLFVMTSLSSNTNARMFAANTLPGTIYELGSGGNTFSAAGSSTGLTIATSTRFMMYISVASLATSCSLNGDTAAAGGTFLNGTRSQIASLGSTSNPDGAANTQPGTYHEVVIAPAVLSNGDRRKLEGYAAWKWWGTDNPLVASHPFKNRPPLIGD